MRKDTAIGAMISVIIAAVAVMAAREEHHREMREKEIKSAYWAGASMAALAPAYAGTNASIYLGAEADKYFKSKGIQR
jgi:gas vesicle protein